MLLLLLACSAEGTWAGACETGGYTYALDLDIEEEFGFLSGEGTMEGVSGPLEGTQDGSEVAFDVLFESAGRGSFLGALSGSELTGTMTYTVATTVTDLSCTLERE